MNLKSLAALFAFAAIFSSSTTENKPDLALFVVTGFGSNNENISLEDLKSGYNAGKVFVTDQSSGAATKFFQSQNGKRTTLNQFLKISKSSIAIVTGNELQGQLKILSVDGVDFFENPNEYPLRLDKEESKKTRVTITGVSALSRSIGILMDEKGPDVIIQHLKPYFQNSDYVHISNEVSLLDTCVLSHKGRRFCSKEEHFKALLGLNCNIVELTGNHNKDYGAKTFINTLNWYRQNNIEIFGGGKDQVDANEPLIITLKDETKLGFIGFNELCPLNECAKPNVPGANAWSSEKARTVIQKMKSEMKVDVVIASVQFGEWDFYHPRLSQRKIAYELLDYGADMVYGPHAHQIQQVEFYKHKPIFFGLGNFLFDETQRIGVRQGFFLHIEIMNGKIVRIKPMFTFMGDDRVNRLANEGQADAIKKLVYIDSLLYK